MYCQPPLQSWGTFYLEKKVLCSCRDRQDGSPVESAPRLAEQAARAGEPNASTTGKRGVCGLAPDPSAQPCGLPARDRRLTCTCAEIRLFCMSEPGSSRCWTSLRAAGLCCCVSSSFPSTMPTSSFYSGREKENGGLKKTLPHASCLRPLLRNSRQREAPRLNPQSGVFFRFSS